MNAYDASAGSARRGAAIWNEKRISDALASGEQRYQITAFSAACGAVTALPS